MSFSTTLCNWEAARKDLEVDFLRKRNKNPGSSRVDSRHKKTWSQNTKKHIAIRPFLWKAIHFLEILGGNFLVGYGVLICMTFVKNMFLFLQFCSTGGHLVPTVQPLKGAKIILTISGMFGWK